MTNLHLEPEETIVLMNMLEECLEELHSEIVRTERAEYRAMLKTREALLRQILQQLRQSQPEPVAV